MLIKCYDYINKIRSNYIHRALHLFNKTAREVCEGQQLDMDFEQREEVTMSEYLKMITLKTSVALAASLKVGAMLGGAGERNQNLLYESGKKLGIAFQVQDDYLDAFGDPTKFGKRTGGDIVANKKTFLLVHAMETASVAAKAELKKQLNGNASDKVEKVLQIFRDCKADKWSVELKNKYMDEAYTHLEDIAVLSKRKEPLKELMQFLVKREY